MKKLICVILCLILSACIMDEPDQNYATIVEEVPALVKYYQGDMMWICETGYILVNGKPYLLYWPYGLREIINVGTEVEYEKQRVVKYKNGCRWNEIEWAVIHITFTE